MYYPFKTVFSTASRSKMISRALPVVALLGCATLFNIANNAPVLAQSAAKRAASEPISIELQAFKVVRDEDGKEKFQTAQNMKPGDILEYRAIYSNVSQKEVKNLQANLPIPVTTQLLLDTVAPKVVKASTDGRVFAPAPLMRSVKLADGSTQMRPLPLSEYRALNWPIGTVKPGQDVTVRARVRLNKTFATE